MIEVRKKPLMAILDKGAYKPIRAHITDAGIDLMSPEDFAVFPHSSYTVDTGVHILIPKGYAGILMSKSGLNVKEDITSTGLIDAGYTGSIVVKLYNHGDSRRYFKKGQKISQLVIVPCETPELEFVKEFPDTERGDNGFGSTGR